MGRLGSLLIALLVLAGCGEDAARFVDGGAFVLPDAAAVDAGREAPDLGAPDTGPFLCAGGCPSGQACGCVGGRCGCQVPAPVGGACDPQAPATCAEGACRIARRNGFDAFVCSDGRAGVSCSKRDDACQTRLGCVCLTPSTGGTDCRCRDELPPGNIFCDPLLAAETCPGFECRRVRGPNGAFFVCANGLEGDGCDERVPTCATSIGCQCPFVDGRRVCACGEPGPAGSPCGGDEDCLDELVCVSDDSDGTLDTVCAERGSMMSGGSGQPCDPNAPDCPPGELCVPEQGGFVCRGR